MIKYLTFEQMIEIHEKMIEKFGGLKGIRDMNLLMSSVEVPKTAVFGQELYPTIAEKAAAYLFHIVKNHPFNDANKRTGFTACLLFLCANKAPINFTDDELEELTLAIAEGNKTKQEVVAFFKSLVVA